MANFENPGPPDKDNLIAEAAQARDKLQNASAELPPQNAGIKPATADSPNIQTTFGIVDHMPMAGWRHLAGTLAPPFKYEAWTLTDTGDPNLTHEFETGRVPRPQDKAAVHSIMSQRDRKLEPDQIEAIRNSFHSEESVPGDFKITQAQTETIGGRKVLFVQGHFTTKGNTGRWRCSVYMNSDPDSEDTLNESFQYTADGLKSFRSHLPDFIKGVRSMSFREQPLI